MEELLLKSPPVRQALVEFRLVHAVDPTVDALGAPSDAFAAEFPKREWLWQGEVTVKIEAESLRAKEAPSTRRGVKYSSADGARVVVFSPASFAYNRARDYVDREAYLPEVRDAYAQYLLSVPDGGTQSEIVRIGVRFINEVVLDIGDRSIDLEDYFVGVPKPITEDPLVGFRVDRQTASDEAAIGTRVQLFNAPPGNDEGTATFILDIDVWDESQRPALWSEGLENVINELFDIRRRLFFRSVHERALARYI